MDTLLAGWSDLSFLLARALIPFHTNINHKMSTFNKYVHSNLQDLIQPLTKLFIHATVHLGSEPLPQLIVLYAHPFLMNDI